MIHPEIKSLFEKDHASLVSWMCRESGSTADISEFIRWHIDANSQTIDEISKIRQVNLDDPDAAKEWACAFLADYNTKIRELREISNRAFERFQHLKYGCVERLITTHPDKREEIESVMRLFLDQRGPLIGKIIFSYREAWFLAKGITCPDMWQDPIKSYVKWIESNISGILRLQQDLNKIEIKIQEKV